MNEEIKKKLFDLEINPPAGTWDKISAALDDEVAAEFPSQLYELELNPPSKVWDSVATTISYSDKLYNLEFAPPASVWNKISNALNETEEVRRVIPIRRIPVWKYAAAASILAFLAFGVKWLTAEKTGTQMAIETQQPKKTEVKPQEIDGPVKGHPATVSTEKQTPKTAEVKQTNNLPKEGPRQANATYTPVKNNSRRQNNFMAAGYKLPTSEFANSDEFCLTSLQTDAPGHQPKFSDASHRYLVFENDNCELIRISKKLAEKLGCNVPDQLTPEYQGCIQQLKKWSEKIAQMNITPSTDNFMNIVELLKSTEEKQF
jgi:hypothetical protein